MKTPTLSDLGNETYGGIASAIVSLPENIIFGLIAFAPLGPEYAAQGILAGMYASVFVGLSASVFGGTPGMVSGPNAPSSLVFGSVIVYLTVSRGMDPADPAQTASILTLAFLVVFLGGLFQAILGFLRFGTLIKYIPYPVIAGFLNGTAMLIIATQVWSFLGIPKGDSILDLWGRLHETQFLTALVGLATMLVIWNAHRIFRKIPASLLGLVAGTFLYYALISSGFGPALGPTIVDIPVRIPTPNYALGFCTLLSDPKIPGLLVGLLPAAFSMAVLVSIDSLMTSLAMENLTNKRSNTNRELVGQGLGNMLAACFGGIAGSGIMARSMVNFRAGGRANLSGGLNGLILLLTLIFLAPLMGMIPKVVLSGMALVLATYIFDRWSIRLLRNMPLKKLNRRYDLLGNFFEILLVMAVTALWNLIAAVAIGLLVSIFIFMTQMSKSVIRRRYRGSAVRSKKQREEKLIKLLSDHGDCISVLELEGSIFFGSADNLTSEIDRIAEEGVSYVILDMKRICQIDSTGARVLEQTYSRLSRQGKRLSVSYLKAGGPLWRFLEEIGSFRVIGEENFFPDTDTALEFFEDLLLNSFLEGTCMDETILLKDLAILHGLQPGELEILKRFLTRLTFDEGETIIRQGNKGDAVFFIAKGTADVTINLHEEDRKMRLKTLTSGTIFGEMALLDGGPRSADVVVREPMVCYRLNLEGFERLKTEYPHISIILLTNISRTFATRLRFANTTISELER